MEKRSNLIKTASSNGRIESVKVEQPKPPEFLKELIDQIEAFITMVNTTKSLGGRFNRVLDKMYKALKQNLGEYYQNYKVALLAQDDFKNNGHGLLFACMESYANVEGLYDVVSLDRITTIDSIETVQNVVNTLGKILEWAKQNK